jgi:UDP-N-acetylmuramate--alanine ligase
MVATVLAAAGLDPTAVVGGKVNVLGSNAKVGKSDLMVVEADESDGSFLHLHPSIAVVTNIDPEHMDHYRTLDALKEAFTSEPGAVHGLDVVHQSPQRAGALLTSRAAVTYGSSHAADYRLERIAPTAATRFRLPPEEDLGTSPCAWWARTAR